MAQQDQPRPGGVGREPSEKDRSEARPSRDRQRPGRTAGDDEPTVVHSVKLPDPVRATPAVAHDTLFVRTDKSLYAFAGSK